MKRKNWQTWRRKNTDSATGNRTRVSGNAHQRSNHWVIMPQLLTALNNLSLNIDPSQCSEIDCSAGHCCFFPSLYPCVSAFFLLIGVLLWFKWCIYPVRNSLFLCPLNSLEMYSNKYLFHLQLQSDGFILQVKWASVILIKTYSWKKRKIAQFN